MKHKSIMTPQALFNHIAKPDIQRSTFDRSHSYKTTFNAGKLIPIMMDIAVPGDTINLSVSMFGRLSTPLKPIMDNMYIDVHCFSVPIRLIWSNWKKFNGEQTNPGDSIAYTIPQIVSTATTGYTEGTIYDYMGLPTKIAGYTHSALFNRAYNLIWNEWYRDENLQNSAYCPVDNGPDTTASYILQPRGKRKDYFTGALPSPQKGTAVSIPLGTSAPVFGTGKSMGFSDGTTSFGAYSDSGGNLAPRVNAYNQNIGSNDPGGASPVSKDIGLVTSGVSGVYADLSTATAATINQLRQSFQIQRMLERDNVGGTRYTEIIRSHFGVTSPDARQQRPEYLGGGTTNVNFNSIAQTSATAATGTPIGNVSASATFATTNPGFVKSFTEHEIIIVLASARADLNYQEGLNKMWSYSTRYDFYWPSFAHLGEQAILNKEIYLQGTSADANVFGYQEQYAEMRYKNSLVTGLYRSNATGTLDIWHLAQDFSSLPVLDSTFIVETPPVSRILAVPSEPAFLLDTYMKYIHARPMPTYGTPSSIGRF